MCRAVRILLEDLENKSLKRTREDFKLQSFYYMKMTTLRRPYCAPAAATIEDTTMPTGHA